MRICRCAAVLLSFIVTSSAFGERSVPLKGTPPGQLIAKVKRAGRIQVIVTARDDPWKPEGFLSRAEVTTQRERIRAKVSELIETHAELKPFDGWRFKTLSAFVVEVKEKTLLDLIDDERVESIEEDAEGDFLLKESTVKIGAVAAHNRTPVSYSGTGKIVVVIDSGVDKNHPFFGTPSRVLDASGACFSGQKRADVNENCCGSNDWTSVCPNGLTTQFGAGSSVPCSLGDMSVNGNPCNHGTRVAGVVAGDNQQTGSARMTGVAPSATIIPIQVGSKGCGAAVGCEMRVLKASVIYALDYVASTLFDNHGSDIAAVNISLSFAGHTASNCDSSNNVFYNSVANVRSHEIAVVVATGNQGSTSMIGVPACLSNVFAVSATDDHDEVPDYADVATIMHLFAPGGGRPAGEGITTSQNQGCIGCDLYWEDEGTSLAAPHVAGAFAILRQRHPTVTAQSLLGTLVRTGMMVADKRPNSTSVTKPRINVNEALDEPVTLAPPTSLTATATGTETVQLTWTAAIPASPRTSYRVTYRTSLGDAWSVVTSTPTTTFTHHNMTPGLLHEYEVVTTDSVGNLSSAATDHVLPLFHDDDPLAPQSTLVKGVHVARLRQAADAWRQFAGLGASFSYDSPSGVVQASDLTDIRLRLNEARDLMGLVAFSYVGVNPPQSGTVIDARHVDQLRAAMR